MTYLVNEKTTQPRSTIESRAGLVRMAAIVAISLAVLFATPPWLHRLESSDSLPTSANETFEVIKVERRLSRSHVSSSTQRGTSEDNVSHQVLADFLGKRYRVSKDALASFIRLAYSAGHKTKVDPLLILSVMAVESTFNPIAESVVGAKGLMQIIPEYHQEKFIGPSGRKLNVLDPETNILAGAKVLREYATRTGDLVAALRLYGGTGSTASPYPEKVLSVRERLSQFLRRTSERRAMSEQAAGPSS